MKEVAMQVVFRVIEKAWRFGLIFINHEDTSSPNMRELTMDIAILLDKHRKSDKFKSETCVRGVYDD